MAKPATVFTVKDSPELFSDEEKAAGATFVTVGGDKASVEAWKARRLERLNREKVG
jgi:hypothetical protein